MRMYYFASQDYLEFLSLPQTTVVGSSLTIKSSKDVKGRRIEVKNQIWVRLRDLRMVACRGWQEMWMG